MTTAPRANAGAEDSQHDMLEEVRAIRRTIWRENGEDIDQLCADLRQVELEYSTHTGRFGNIAVRSGKDVADKWTK